MIFTTHLAFAANAGSPIAESASLEVRGSSFGTVHGTSQEAHAGTLSRREAAFPRAVINRPDGPLTVVMAANPQDGDEDENE